MSRNPHWARDFASAIKRVSSDQANAGMPLIEVALVTKRKPSVILQPEGSEVAYQADDITWGIDPSTLQIGDAVLLVRDTSDLPVVLAVLDGDNPDPTKHVKGKALVRTVNSIQQQSRFWKAPVANAASLTATTTDADGTVRLDLDANTLSRWSANTDTWIPISGSGGGASDFSDLTGSLAAGQVVDGSLPLSKLAVDPLARANHTGTQAQSTVTDLVSDLALKAPLASPGLTGVPTAPTATLGTNTTQIATTAFTQAAVAALVDSAPATLDTLNELAAALGDDPNFATTITTALSLKAPLASPGLTGVPTAPTAAGGTSTTQLATTAFVAGEIATAVGSYQPLDSDLTTFAALAPSNDDILQRKAGAWTNRTMAQLKTDLVLVKGDVGLGNVDNTSDVNKPVSTAQQTALDLKANLASPTFTGTVTIAGLTGGAGAVNLTGSTTVTVPTVAIGAGSNAATIGAVNTALGSYLTTATAASTYVALTGNQTVAGEKTFTDDTTVQKANPILRLDAVSGTSSLRFVENGGLQWTLDGNSTKFGIFRSLVGYYFEVTTAGTVELPQATSSGNAFVLGTDAGFFRSAAGVLQMQSGDKWQQNAAPTVGDDLVNKTYADLKLPLTGGTLTGDLTIDRNGAAATGRITVDVDGGQQGGFRIREDGVSIWEMYKRASNDDFRLNNEVLASAAVTVSVTTNIADFNERPTHDGTQLATTTETDAVRRRAFFGL